MPVLEDGTVISEEEARRREQEYADMIARTGGTGIATSGYDLGIDWNFSPFETGGGTLNLGLEQAPNLSADITFDPTAGWENAFISGSDISGQGMANVGDATLDLTAGIQNILGPSPANPYMNVALNDALPGLDLSAGTNTLPQATFSAGNLEDLGYSLNLNAISGEDLQASFAKQLTPGVTANISTNPTKANPSGLKFESSWGDAGKMLRQFLNAINPINYAGADSSVPEIAVAPSMQGVDYSQALADVGIEPTTAGMVEVDLPFFDRFPLAEQSMDQGTFDAIEHIDAIYGGPATTTSQSDTDLRTMWKEDFVPNLSNSAIEMVMRKGIPGMWPGDDIETATTAESIKDAVNNIAIMDAKKGGIPKDDLIHSVITGVNPLITTNQNMDPTKGVLSPFYAAEDYVSKGGKLDQDDARQMAFQVDEFMDLSTQPVGHVARKSDAWDWDKPSVTHVPAEPVLPAYSGPTAAERKAQSDAQRKQAMADKKAAADAQKRFNELAAKASQQQQAQAAQAAEVQAAIDRVASANAIMAKYSGRREPAENYMSAAERNMVAAANVDTFANMVAEGPMSAAEINVAGGMEFGGAGGMAGSGRGSSGRGGPGGRGR